MVHALNSKNSLFLSTKDIMTRQVQTCPVQLNSKQQWGCEDLKHPDYVHPL